MADDKPQPKDAAPEVAGRFTGPSERLRATAKWLVVSAGAVAAAVVAGLNFAGIGKLTSESPDHRLAWAIGGAGAALIGIAWMLGATVALAGASTVGVRELRWRYVDGITEIRAAIDADTALAYWQRPGQRTFEVFVGDLELAQRRYVNELTLWTNNPHPSPSAAILQRREQHRNYLQSVATRSLETASYLRLLHAFRRTCGHLVAGLLLTGAGLVSVVWASNPPDGAKVELGASPISAHFAVPAEDRADLRARLGASCTANLDSLAVIVLSTDAEQHTATVVVSEQQCDPIRLDVAVDRLLVEL